MFKPYYETSLGTLYHGDCFDIMGDIDPVDLILTDPPYGINYQSNYRIVRYDKIKGDGDIDWIGRYFEAIKKLFNGHAYFFAPYQKLDVHMSKCRNNLPFKNLLIWEKNNTGMGDLSGDYAPKYEPILFCSDGRNLNGKRDPNILKFRRSLNELHPTQKPIALLQYLIEKSTNENDIVLDTFFGSGSTAVACENLNRRWIGIEMSEKYCEIAKNRIKKERQQLKLFF